MSVAHSRRTSRRPSAERIGLRGERFLQIALDAVLLETGGLVHLVARIAEDLDDPDLEPVLRLAGSLAYDDRALVFLDHRRRSHPVQRLVAARVGVDEDRAVSLEEEQPGGLRQDGCEPPRVDDLAAGDDDSHGARGYCPFRTSHRGVTWTQGVWARTAGPRNGLVARIRPGGSIADDVRFGQVQGQWRQRPASWSDFD